MIKVSELFNVYSGSKLDFSKQQLDDDGINFVSRNSNNNGIVGKVVLEESMKVFQKGDISVPLGGAFLLSAFVQQEDFVTAQNVAVLRPKQSMTEIEKWFYCYALRLNRPKFVAFGREVNKYLNDIELPDTIPDWVYKANITKYITKNKPGDNELNTNEWQTFTLNDIFQLKGGFYNKKPEHSTEGNIPFLASTESNNGVTEYYSLEDIETWDKVGKQDNKLDKKLYNGNCIAVTVNGSVCNAFYQSEQFVCSHDITALYLKGHTLNQYIALFLCSVIMKEKYRRSYGRKPHDVKKFGKSIIKLPVDSSGNPDRKFMEIYIKNLPYGDRI